MRKDGFARNIRGIHDLGASGMTTDMRVAADAAVRPPQKRSGCYRFLRCGCFTVLTFVLLIVAWQYWPSFDKPSTTRYSLLPASATHIMSTRDVTRLGTGQVFYFPVAEVPSWFAAAGIKRGDPSHLAIVNTLGSKALLVQLKRPSSDIFANLEQRLGVARTAGNYRVIEFKPPKKESPSPMWWWAVANEQSLVVGHPVAVREILDVASGSRPDIASRRVLKPLLADFENDVSFDLKLVPESREAEIRGAQVLVEKFSNVPGASLLVGGRGMGISLEQRPGGDCVAKLDFQYNGRASAFFVAGIFHVFRTLGGPGFLSDSKQNAPREVVVDRRGGLVALHFYSDKTQCEEAWRTNSASVELFPADERQRPARKKSRR
jgi:hypothetical protein